MRRSILFISIFLSILAFSAKAQSEIPAFPGAEGGGTFTTGGRGGEVYFVTSLEDTNTGDTATREGTLRWCLSRAGSKTIVFRVAGIIRLKSVLKITDNTTIAGQTAPGEGICLADNTAQIEGNNIIVRFMRFRMGDLTATENDAFWGRRFSNIIIDHCSMSWSTDECASFYDNTNFTLQWSILSESLRASVHDKGNHGYGGIWGGKTATFHHNLLAHHDSRNPRMCGSRYSNKPELELVDFRNNVIYNWGSNSGYAGEGGNYNFVNNYYKPGAESNNPGRIFQPNADDGSNAQPKGVWGKFYVNGNYIYGNEAVNKDNWTGIHPNPPNKAKSELKSESEFEVPAVTTHSAQKAYEAVLDYAGACVSRDSTDLRITNEVENGLAPHRASNGTTRGGLIDSQSDVGGWETYSYIKEDLPVDNDRDGMDDTWETNNNLSPSDPADGKLLAKNGYTNLENYLNSLVGDIYPESDLVSAKTIKLERSFIRVFPNPADGVTQIEWKNTMNESVDIEIISSTGKRFTPELSLTTSNGKTTATFNSSGLSKGLYFCRLASSTKIEPVKFMVK